MNTISKLSSLLALTDSTDGRHDWALKCIDDHFSLTAELERDAMQLTRIAMETTAQWEETFSLLNDRTAEILKSFEQFDGLDRQFLEWSQRWGAALSVFHKELPKRGWYLIGKEDFPLTKELVQYIEAKNWKALDDALVEHAADFSIDAENFTQSLRELAVRECTIGRVKLFLEAREAGNHEVATLIGVPLIDELCRSLHNGKDFTTKRGKQPKPQLACRTANDPELGEYFAGFVQEFGLVHKDVDTTRLEDEDYFNRSAILHGQMERSYGPKDSAKAFLIILFLALACESESSEVEQVD